MTRVVIAAMGTRGDVAPLTDVGVRLLAAGHQVVLAASRPFAAEIQRCGLEFRAMGGDFRETEIAGASPAKLVLTAVSPASVRAMGELVLTALENEKADVLLLSPWAEFAGHPFAEANGIPSIGVRLQPLSATAAHPPSVLGAWSLGGPGNRLAGAAGGALVDRVYGNVVNDIRARVGLSATSVSALRRRRTEAGWPILHGYSPAVVPRPRDWRTGLEVVGYWWPQVVPGWRPPAELVDFLDAGPPPVFLGFGSVMTGPKAAARLSELALAALRAAGVRGVIQAGWANLDVRSDDVITIGDVPHEWLFPRMAAVVHACGAGTTAAGLRAGVPAVGVPVAGDQPFWAYRLRELGVSPATVPYWRLTAGRLAAAVQAAVKDPAYGRAAREIASHLAEEDGAGAVVKAVEQALC
ncbi:glycosyltransferase [Fodinicola feengrottensis]|uniref:Glycosyltransferase n=1 Tax=Fodinicola feengrottensis TaxID=435914 RepID=A0ABN2IVW6_9ACTN